MQLGSEDGDVFRYKLGWEKIKETACYLSRSGCSGLAEGKRGRKSREGRKEGGTHLKPLARSQGSPTHCHLQLPMQGSCHPPPSRAITKVFSCQPDTHCWWYFFPAMVIKDSGNEDSGDLSSNSGSATSHINKCFLGASCVLGPVLDTVGQGQRRDRAISQAPSSEGSVC